MPLYEYVCNECNQRFEALVRREQVQKIACHSCESPDVRRVVSGFAMVGGYDDEYVPRASSGGGGCCGGGCGCSH